MSTANEKKEQQEEKLLENFAWNNETDFFGVPGTAPEELKEKEEIEKEKKEGKPAKEKDEKEVKDEKVEEEPFEKREEEEEIDDDEDDYTELTETFVKDGILSTVKLQKGEKISKDKFFELQDEEVENRTEEAIQSIMEEVGEDGAAYLKYVKSGGKTSDFFREMSSVISTPQVDITKPEGQEAMVRFYLSVIEGNDESEISDRIEYLKEAGGDKLKSYAEKYHKKISDAELKQREKIIKQQEDNAKKAKKAYDSFVESVNTTLSEVEQVGNFVFTNKDKKELGKFLTKSTNDLGITDFNYAIRSLFASENKEKLLLLAKLLKNDFDISDITKEVETKVTRRAKESLKSQGKGVSPASSGSRKERSLADYFG